MRSGEGDTIVNSGLPSKIDLMDLELPGDPYPTYARLRRAGALSRAGPATWAITRYAEVAALLRDQRVGHEPPRELRQPAVLGGRGLDVDQMMSKLSEIKTNRALPRIVSALDPPDHTQIRRLMQKAFSLVEIHRLQKHIQNTVDGLITRAIDRGYLDAVADLGLPLQMSIACEQLGVLEADRGVVCRNAMELGRGIILAPFVTDEGGNGEEAARWLRDYVASLVVARRRAPRDDLISYMLEVREGEKRLTDDEIIDNAVFLFFAGFETSIHLIASGCAQLLRFPNELARLRADRSLIPSAVEEILRYDAPLQWISRITVAPIDIDGRTLKAGRILLLLLASANHDERQFDDPECLDVGRRPNPHLSFGGGVHHCLGVAVVRTQGAIVFEKLLARCAVLELASQPVLRHHPCVRGYASVAVVVKAA